MKEQEVQEQITIDLGDEYEQALTDATQEEIIDLAGMLYITVVLYFYIINLQLTFLAILGFHSMMNQDQYHASLLNKGQPVGLGWDGITKASTPKFFPQDPPNTTDVDKTIQQVKDDDHTLIDLNWNNIKVNTSLEQFVFRADLKYFIILFVAEHLG